MRLAESQRDGEYRAPFRTIAGTDGPPVGIHNRPGDCETYSEAVRLGRYEWCEQLRREILRKPAPGIAHGDLDVRAPDFHANRDVSLARRHFGHRIHGIHQQV